jgi:hypothetical protein
MTKSVVIITFAVVLGLAWYVPHTKREAVNACRFEVSKKWNDVLDNACIQTWSPFYNRDGKNAFPTCDEMAIAKKFMIACMGASGFSTADDCNTDDSARFLGNCYRRSLPLQIFDSIAESDLISDSTPSPWMGYIWNSAEQHYEWLLAQFKTPNECQLALEQSIGTFFYTRPVGCAYAGNNLFRVRIMNALYGGANYTCIAESATPAEAEKIGMRYGPAIGLVPTDPNSWHCIDTVELQIPDATSCQGTKPTPPGQARILESCAVKFDGLPELGTKRRQITWNVLRAHPCANDQSHASGLGDAEVQALCRF